MMEQREKFTRQGITSEFLGETQTDCAVINKVIKGNVQLVYASPEAILCTENMLLSDPYKENLVALVVDEAHCVKTWYVYYCFLKDRRTP